jgi:hypothetical protein
MVKGLDYMIENVFYSIRDRNENLGNYIGIQFNNMTRIHDLFLTQEAYNSQIGKTRIGKNLGMEAVEWDGTVSGVEKVKAEVCNRFVSKEEFRNFGGRQKRIKPQTENYENYPLLYN